MKTTIVGVFDKTENAERAILDLTTLGVLDTDISYVYSSKGKIIEEGGRKAGEGLSSGASAGAVLGALAGFAVANGVLPGLGSLLVAGPLAAAPGLTGAAATTAAGAITGAAAGGLVGALVGLGIKEEEAKVYEERVREGSILVTARTDNASEARSIFMKHSADEVREYPE